jgi:hypothetical protein
MKLSDFALIVGSHADIRTTKRGCVNNVVSMLSGAQTVDDDPTCVCQAVRAYSVALNDAHWPSAEERTRALLPLVPLMMETRDGREGERARYLADVALRVFAPWALRAAGLRREARELRRNPTREQARLASTRSWPPPAAAAAGAAASDAASDAAGAAACDAASNAALAATWTAACDAARAAAEAAAWTAACDAARDAALAAAWTAACDAARNAALAATGAAAAATYAAYADARILRAAACALKRACLLGMSTWEASALPSCRPTH